MNKKNLKYVVYSFFLFLSIEIIVQSKGYGIMDYIKSFADLQGYSDRLSKDLNVSFSNGVSEKNTPAHWTLKPSSEQESHAPAVKSNARAIHVFELLAEEFAKLPEKAASILNYIVITQDLKNVGLQAAGIYDSKVGAVYISTNSNVEPFDDVFMISTFHHELSSMLMEKYHFDESGWRKILGENFKYESDKNPFYFIAVLENDIEFKSDEYYFKRGLVSYYGETGVENDYNEYVGMIFSEPEKMKLLISEYPKIKEKYAYIKSFYLSIDQGFQPFFDKIDAG